MIKIDILDSAQFERSPDLVEKVMMRPKPKYESMHDRHEENEKTRKNKGIKTKLSLFNNNPNKFILKHTLARYFRLGR